MNIEVSAEKFKEAIHLIERIAGKHPTLPVLSCILIESTKNAVILRATNLDVGMEISIPAKTDSETRIAVPANILSSFIDQISEQNQTIKLSESSGNVTISSQKTKSILKTLPNEDFPSVPRVSQGEKLVINSGLVSKGLSSVSYSSSISSVKPELSSVYVYSESNQLVFAATDSFRLAEKRIRLTNQISKCDILIPFKNTPDIIRFLEYVNKDVDIKYNKNLISFETNDVYLVSRVIDGVFPDYKQIIPKSFASEAVVLKQDFWNAIKISNIFSDKFNQIHFYIDPAKKLFEIQTKNSDIGENKTSIDAALTGESVEINFNYKYISDCFQSIDSDSLSLQLSGTNKPMVIRPIAGDQNFMYLVMPMNR
jgi:DNA polymerase-3 subunit beta